MNNGNSFLTSSIGLEVIEELARIKRVSDLLCSGHSLLRDEYRLKALCLDTAILAISVWLTAMAFVDPVIGDKLTLLSIRREVWLGLLAIGVFFLSIVQIRVDWKGLSDAHQRACHFYGKIKIECNSLTTRPEVIAEEQFQRLKEMYIVAGEVSISIPESRFNSLKKSHKLKQEISKILDIKPASSIWLIKIKLWLRDNLHLPKGKLHGPE